MEQNQQRGRKTEAPEPTYYHNETCTYLSAQDPTYLRREAHMK